MENKMAANLTLDNTLLRTSLEIEELTAKRETASLVLDEFAKKKKRQEMIELFGTIDFDENYDYKKLRAKTRSVARTIDKISSPS
jgi:hypothetical protein